MVHIFVFASMFFSTCFLPVSSCQSKHVPADCWPTRSCIVGSDKVTFFALYYMFGPVMLLCGTFLFYLMNEGSVPLSDCEHHQTNTPIRPPAFHIHTDTVLPLLIVLLESEKSRSETVPPLCICSFTQTAMRKICAWFPHWEGSVDGATVSSGQLWSLLFSISLQKQRNIVFADF